MTRVVVIGAGISGLSTAYAIETLAAQVALSVEVRVVEKLDRTGGKIHSIHDSGFLCEWGTNGFLDNKPMTLDLCKQLQIDGQLLRSDDNASKQLTDHTGAAQHGHHLTRHPGCNQYDKKL